MFRFSSTGAGKGTGGGGQEEREEGKMEIKGRIERTKAI